jgi:hypothetical protein
MASKPVQSPLGKKDETLTKSVLDLSSSSIDHGSAHGKLSRSVISASSTPDRIPSSGGRIADVSSAPHNHGHNSYMASSSAVHGIAIDNSRFSDADFANAGAVAVGSRSHAVDESEIVIDDSSSDADVIRGNDQMGDCDQQRVIDSVHSSFLNDVHVDSSHSSQGSTKKRKPFQTNDDWIHWALSDVQTQNGRIVVDADAPNRDHPANISHESSIGSNNYNRSDGVSIEHSEDLGKRLNRIMENRWVNWH